MKVYQPQSYYSRYIKHALLGLVALVLVACKPPTAEFSVSPNAYEGEPVSFDASASTVDLSKSKENGIVSYQWEFGDGVTAEGVKVNHIYKKPGSFEVTLTVTDKAEQKGKKSQTVVVTKKVIPILSANVAVTDVQGNALAGVNISVDGVSGSTDANGNVALNIPKNSADNVVVTAKKSGYIDQAVVVAKANIASIKLSLLPTKKEQSIADIETEKTVMIDGLNVEITIPNNAFTDIYGSIATGSAKAIVTPWNLNGTDANAFLGNGKAVATDGTNRIITALGLLTVSFVDEDGNALNVNSGKTITVAMPATNTPNGQTLTPNSSLITWRFDADKGLWNQAGIGTVVEKSGNMYLQADMSSLSSLAWSSN